MNDDKYESMCCTGDCLQGRKCPRYREERRHDTALFAVAVLGWVLFFCFISGYLYGVIAP